MMRVHLVLVKTAHRCLITASTNSSAPLFRCSSALCVFADAALRVSAWVKRVRVHASTLRAMIKNQTRCRYKPLPSIVWALEESMDNRYFVFRINAYGVCAEICADAGFLR
jgi:hypothetical protein